MSVEHRVVLPRPITRSSVLLYACAAVFVIDAAAGISAVRHTDAALGAFRRTEGPGPGDLLLVAAADIRASLHYNLAVTVAALVVVAALGFAIRRPFPAARPCVWVAASIVAVAQLLGVADGPENGISLTGLEPVAIQDAMRHLLVGWYPGLHGVLVALVIGGVIAVSVLIRADTAEDFYRRQDGGESLESWAARRREASG